MTLDKLSGCKVNLLLNILGKRADGFHELETVMHPVQLFDRISFERGGSGVAMTCSEPALPVDATNLVHRAATAFLQAAGLRDGVKLHLEKRIPMAAGLGGGSGNAATTLLGLNELFGQPLDTKTLMALAAALGSDVPFFLQDRPALCTGRGETITALESFPALNGLAFLLIHPGFGIATAWAYKKLAKFPEALNGQPGRAQRLISLLQSGDVAAASGEFYNSLEAPALTKYPVLALYQEFLREHGAVAALMSGSGSTTFALVRSVAEGEAVAEKFKQQFGRACWTTVVAVRC
ncbi:MAG: 4-(cytidine 5'-diphospho)-2-C-methyl-D-erythritol kinase [Verrucomicrobia bacterium]|nr:4-(cytidine 5'-diphospho)-2-C-methyl-D-erythritol kinase [Verrucomicrobiota bacterium]